MKRWLIAAVALVWSATAWANEAIPTAQDPVAAARAVALAHKLRCLVCQNQSIADSDADLAKDLRRQIAEQIAAGRSDAEIVAFMTDRYGDFVLYRPPIKATTLVLWIAPAVLLVVAALTLRRALRQRPVATAMATADAPGMSSADRARAQALLDDPDRGSPS